MAGQMAAPVGLVLGAAVWAGGVASPTLKRRTMHAVKLFHDGKISHIIGCGGIGKHAPSEAEVIGQICLQNAVPQSCISREARSTNTYENIRNCVALLAGRDVVIVTDEYHAPRAKMTAKYLGLSAICSSPESARPNLKTRLRELSAFAIYRFKFWRGVF